MERVLQFVTVEPTDIATVRSAWKVQARYRFSYFDSLIIAQHWLRIAPRCTVKICNTVRLSAVV
jgi:predicted nucleic acid-binding protein